MMHGGLGQRRQVLAKPTIHFPEGRPSPHQHIEYEELALSPDLFHLTRRERYIESFSVWDLKGRVFWKGQLVWS